MNFKNRYKNDIEKIVPDDTFLSKLSSEMENARAEKKRSKIRIAYSSVAAVLVLAVFGVGFRFYNSSLSPKTDSSKNNNSNGNIIINAGKDSSDNLATNQFGETDKWCDDSLSVQENLNIFISKLSNPNDIKKLYSSSEEVFTDSDLMVPEQIRNISEKIKTATIYEETIPDNSPQYYMAVLNDGNIVKFTIFDHKYITVNDLESTFAIN